MKIDNETLKHLFVLIIGLGVVALRAINAISEYNFMLVVMFIGGYLFKNGAYKWHKKNNKKKENG